MALTLRDDAELTERNRLAENAIDPPVAPPPLPPVPSDPALDPPAPSRPLPLPGTDLPPAAPPNRGLEPDPLAASPDRRQPAGAMTGPQSADGEAARPFQSEVIAALTAFDLLDAGH